MHRLSDSGIKIMRSETGHRKEEEREDWRKLHNE
jgi:hypothetical protein